MLLFDCKFFFSIGVKMWGEKKLKKALFYFTFNATLTDFKISLVAEKIQEN